MRAAATIVALLVSLLSVNAKLECKSNIFRSMGQIVYKTEPRGKWHVYAILTKKPFIIVLPRILDITCAISVTLPTTDVKGRRLKRGRTSEAVVNVASVKYEGVLLGLYCDNYVGS